MQRKSSYQVTTEQTEDASSQQPIQTKFINSLEYANIIDVWNDNFHQEIQRISTLTKTYNIVSIDTQFPLIQELAQKKQSFNSTSIHQKYQKICKNVDSTSLIQLGLCISDENGNVPQQRFCWQFNFKYQQNIQQISPSSFSLLIKSGIDFQKFIRNGINYKTFTHQFIKSGLLLNKKIKWIVFHGCYDFSYLLKLIKSEYLPKTIDDYYKSVKIYFPQKVDVKNYLQKDFNLKRFGLSKLADTLLCRRIGPEHQAGSDCLLTLQCYFKLKRQFNYLFQNSPQIDNLIYGVGDIPQIQQKSHLYPTKNQYYENYQDQNTSNQFINNSYSQMFSSINYNNQDNYAHSVPYYMYYSNDQSNNYSSSSSYLSYELVYQPTYNSPYQKPYKDPNIKKCLYKERL